MYSNKEEKFCSGFVSIIGAPNVGKSTLLNHILNTKISIVSPKPQTTRNKILGVKNINHGQIIFVDTPGIHYAKSPLNRFMVQQALSSYEEMDVILFLVEAFLSQPRKEDHLIVQTLEPVKTPVLLTVNKIDVVPGKDLSALIQQYFSLYPFASHLCISAITGEGIPELLKEIEKRLPTGPRYFPEDVITDQPERFIAKEIIQEKIFCLTGEEIPYSTAVFVEEFTEKENMIVIRATIYVEKNSQKGIMIGKGGKMLKEIGTQAREELEKLLGIKIYLELWVKVLKDWRKDSRALKKFGYQ